MVPSEEIVYSYHYNTNDYVHFHRTYMYNIITSYFTNFINSDSIAQNWREICCDIWILWGHISLYGYSGASTTAYLETVSNKYLIYKWALIRFTTHSGSDLLILPHSMHEELLRLSTATIRLRLVTICSRYPRHMATQFLLRLSTATIRLRLVIICSRYPRHMAT